MQLLPITTSEICLRLDAEDFLILATACQIAADYADDGGNQTSELKRTEGKLYRTLAFAFEGYATVSQAQTLLHPRDYGKLAMPVICKAWCLAGDGEVTA